MALIKLELTLSDFSLLRSSVWQEKERNTDVGYERFESLLNKLMSKENLDALKKDWVICNGTD